MGNVETFWDKDGSKSFNYEVSLLMVILIIINQMAILSDTDWKNNKVIGNPLEELAKVFMVAGCTTSGLRLICSGKEGFPLRDLTYWDTILGCLFYSLAFIFFLWLLTPLPDITTHLFIVVQFQDRAPGQEEAEHVAPELHWDPAGGEGPILNH